MVQSQEFLALGLDEIIGLPMMIQAVKFAHGRTRIGLVVAKLLLFLVGIYRLERLGRLARFGVNRFNKIIFDKDFLPF